jgi:hypothetical protein
VTVSWSGADVLPMAVGGVAVWRMVFFFGISDLKWRSCASIVMGNYLSDKVVMDKYG